MNETAVVEVATNCRVSPKYRNSTRKLHVHELLGNVPKLVAVLECERKFIVGVELRAVGKTMRRGGQLRHALPETRRQKRHLRHVQKRIGVPGGHTSRPVTVRMHSHVHSLCVKHSLQLLLGHLSPLA